MSTINTVPHQQRYLEIFLVYDVGNNARRIDFNDFFDKSMPDISTHIAIKPIFFSKEKALDYMTFMDVHHCILRAYVPESAIEGYFDELCLKKDRLTHEQIHGCFPHHAKGKIYIENIDFNQYLLTLVTIKEDLS